MTSIPQGGIKHTLPTQTVQANHSVNVASVAKNPVAFQAAAATAPKDSVEIRDNKANEKSANTKNEAKQFEDTFVNSACKYFKLGKFGSLLLS